MALRYSCDEQVIESCLGLLKKAGRVSGEAYFNHTASNDLRSEVAYRDGDFLEYLGYTKEEDVIDSILHMLKQNGILTAAAQYDKTAFLELRQEVKGKFDNQLVLQPTMSYGTITPVMERLFYMLSSVRKPKRILALGIFWGNALIWNVGSSCGKGKVYDTEKVYGIDIDSHAVDQARKNFNKLSGIERIEWIANDGLQTVEKLNDTYDYVFLDVGIRNDKRLNLILLKKLYQKLQKGCWVLAHDTTMHFFKEHFKSYLDFVRDKSFFSESISFDVDQYGLELSIK